MISITHTLFALAVLTKKDQPLRNRAVFVGSVIPDAFIYIVAPIWYFLGVQPMSHFWNVVYFDEPMQMIASLFNSIPIYLFLAVGGYAFRHTKLGCITLFIALAALLHIPMDFPVHNHDAYAHFWPLTDWKYYAPFSYYEQHLHAHWVGLIEAIIALCSAFVIARRFKVTWVTMTMLVLSGLYMAMNIMRWISL